MGAMIAYLIKKSNIQILKTAPMDIGAGVKNKNVFLSLLTAGLEMIPV
jgi:hypothetical protein